MRHLSQVCHRRPQCQNRVLQRWGRLPLAVAVRALPPIGPPGFRLSTIRLPRALCLRVRCVPHLDQSHHSDARKNLVKVLWNMKQTNLEMEFTFLKLIRNWIHLLNTYRNLIHFLNYRIDFFYKSLYKLTTNTEYSYLDLRDEFLNSTTPNMPSNTALSNWGHQLQSCTLIAWSIALPRPWGTLCFPSHFFLWCSVCFQGLPRSCCSRSCNEADFLSSFFLFPEHRNW